MKPAPAAIALCLVAAGCAPADRPAGAGVAPAPAPAPVERAYTDQVVDAVNAARTDPAGYTLRVRAFRALMRGDRIERPGEVAVATREGVVAVDEAIAFLERQPALPALSRSGPLDRAASDHADDQRRSGRTGHVGGDGSRPSDRIRRHGRFAATAEAIAYGPERAEDMAMQLIIDDGVPDRGHRRILFSPDYALVGVACGPHPTWRRVCVLDFARVG